MSFGADQFGMHARLEFGRWPRRRRGRLRFRRCRRDRERGAALVEAALVAPVVFGLLVGVVEAGWFMQAYLTLEAVTREAARTVAVNGTEVDADHQVLETVDEHLGANNRDAINRIVVFRASTLDAQPPAVCRNGAAPGTVADGCSVYLGSDLGKAAGALTCGWCPEDRVPGEKLGVWIEMNYRSPTGLSGDRVLSDTSIQRLEQGS